MSDLKVNYFKDKLRLNFVWETIIERNYFIEELVLSFFTAFPKLKTINNYKYFSNCGSYKDLYYRLNGINYLEKFVSTFDYGLWENEDFEF